MILELGHHGFGSQLIKIISYLYEMKYSDNDINKLVINWKVEEAWNYWDDKSNKDLNVFLYYFKENIFHNIQNSGEKIKKFKYKKYYPQINSFEPDFRKKITKIRKECLIPNDEIQKNINEYLKPYKNKIKVGCHIRGAPIRRFREDGIIEDIQNKDENIIMEEFLDKYLFKIDKLYENFKDKMEVFIFTDNEPTINYLLNKTKNRDYEIKYYKDINRSVRFLRAEIHKNRLNKNREYNQRKHGEEILKELYTMLEMDHFISILPGGNIPKFVINSNDKIIYHNII